MDYTSVAQPPRVCCRLGVNVCLSLSDPGLTLSISQRSSVSSMLTGTGESSANEKPHTSIHTYMIAGTRATYARRQPLSLSFCRFCFCSTSRWAAINSPKQQVHSVSLTLIFLSLSTSASFIFSPQREASPAERICHSRFSHLSKQNYQTFPSSNLLVVMTALAARFLASVNWMFLVTGV